MNGFTLKRIDELPSIHHGAVKLAADELGIESFGMQLLEFPPGFDGYPEHDHAADRQEEVYMVLDGSARFTIDGERVDVGVGTLLRVAPEATRTLVPGPEGVRYLAIGSTVDGAYERPADFRVGANA